MKTIIQCPHCRALKFVEIETKKIFWVPLRSNELLALHTIMSSSTLMVVTGEIKIIAETCPDCYSQIFN